MMVKHGADLIAVNKVSYNRPPLLLAAQNGSLFVCKMLVDHFKQDINVISIEGQGILESIEQNRKFLATRDEQITAGIVNYALVRIYLLSFFFLIAMIQ
jgi:hypothetical protein